MQGVGGGLGSSRMSSGGLSSKYTWPFGDLDVLLADLVLDNIAAAEHLEIQLGPLPKVLFHGPGRAGGYISAVGVAAHLIAGSLYGAPGGKRRESVCGFWRQQSPSPAKRECFYGR